MAADWVELGKEVIKFAVQARYSFAIWVTSLIVLVVPFPAFMRLESIRENYGQYLGFVSLIAFIVWAVEVTLLASGRIGTYLAARSERLSTLKYLDSLNPEEAHLLVFAVSKKMQTVIWRKEYDEVSSLVSKGLLFVVADNSSYINKPFTVPHFVWDEINKPKILEKLKAFDKETKRS